MNATELYQAGRLQDAIETLGVELRSDPTDVQRRTFLFELLCFAGDYERAEKQLDVLAAGTKDSAVGALLYRSALHATRVREQEFVGANGRAARALSPRVRGRLNGTPFSTLADADTRVGARLELYAAGQYLRIAFRDLESIRIEPPRRLRDLLWIPAAIKTAPSFRGIELGEVLLPTLTPFAWEYDSDDIRLGRVTEWGEGDGGHALPVGLKVLLADDREVSLLDVRELTIEGTVDD